ncbi:hypothetical protein KEM56_001017 [Ascosphaera pollenicola]|nr:hypothetical protein KEM56_001017 [Ascosphaera pollenicola]
MNMSKLYSKKVESWLNSHIKMHLQPSILQSDSLASPVLYLSSPLTPIPAFISPINTSAYPSTHRASSYLLIRKHTTANRTAMRSKYRLFPVPVPVPVFGSRLISSNTAFANAVRAPSLLPMRMDYWTIRAYIFGIIAARKQVNATKRHNDHDGDELERLSNAKKRASEVKPGVSRPDVMVSTRATRTTHREKENVSGQPNPVPPESSSFQFSAGDSLASFMALRGRKPQTSKHEILHSVNKPNQIDINSRSHLQSNQSSFPEKKTITIPIPAPPNIPPPNQPLTLILSTALLKTHRHLIQDLELLPQSCHLIFRDYEDDHPRMPAHSADAPAPDMQEADIILSPKTGIIISSLQETMHRYLPGHTPKHNFASTLGNTKPLDSPLKTKVAMAAARYEKLYVLICHTPSKTETVPSFSSSASGSTPEHPSEGCNNKLVLDERSHRAITTFSSFCAAFSPHTSVTPVIVSPASARMMTDWVVGLANKSHKNMPWSLGEDLPLGSSQYEMVLRKAGLNTFAALFVLWWNDDIKMINPVDQRQRTSEANMLARFVTMSSFERQEKFGDMLGRGLLKRAERAIELIRREKFVRDA